MAGKNLKLSIVSNFFIAFVLDGLQRQSGLFIWEILRTMNVNRQTAALPFCVSWAVANIMASFSDIFAHNKKSDYVILVGVLLTASGAALCLLTSSITTLVFSWGLLFGIGYGISSPQLSKQLRNVDSFKASLFLQATPNVGAIIMPFVTYAVITCYGLQGSYVIFSGIILNYLPLFVAAAYDLEFRFPDINWRMRKRSSQYFVSKQNESEVVSNESFINSLEPDLILKISQSEESGDEMKSDRENSETNIELFQTSRKMNDTKSNDLQNLEVDPRVFPLNKTQSEIFIEIQNYENGRRIFEGSFSNKDHVYENKNHCDSLRSIESQTCVIITSDKSDKLIKEKSYINLKDEAIQAHSEDNDAHINEGNNKSGRKCSQNQEDEKDNTIFQNSKLTENKSLSEFSKQQNNAFYVNKECIKKSRKSMDNKIANTVCETASVSKNNFNPTTSPESDFKLSAQFLKETLPVIPIDIKVYVEECTFTADEEYWLENIDIQYPIPKKNNYRKHSNSMLPGTYDNIDFTTLNFSKHFPKSSELHKPKLSNIYSISENAEFDDYTRISLERNNAKQNGTNYTISNIKRAFKFINEVTKPICICIILITIIFEFNLVTLIVMFADFGNDIGEDFSDSKWILVSFGIGGLLGKFCCCKISKTIPENSHGIGVMLFLLKGLSIAGVLFSSSMEWLAVFYCILGALEGGITYTIPKLISEHIDKDIHGKLTSAKKFLSGLAVICIPYMIGFSRDRLCDYEFLLQTLSCSCVFCAFLTYFVPQLSRASEQITK